MQRLKIDSTESTFAIDLDINKGEFMFSGESRPENAPGFFEPILNWLTDFKKELENYEKSERYKLKAIFNLEYFNSTSTKYIVDIAKILKQIDDLENVELNTEWHYKEIDEDVEESGKELSDWTGLKIDLIPFD